MPNYTLDQNSRLGELLANRDGPLARRLTGGNTGIVPPTVNTGGPLPPSTYTPQPRTGGGLPPSPYVPNVNTGGGLPPTPATPNVHTGGGLPPSPYVPNVNTGGGLPPTPANGNTGIVPPWLQNLPPPQQGQPAQQQGGFSPVDIVNQMVDGLMKGRIGQDARQQGVEFANSRGLLNSSIAAGNSERAALEALNPYVDQGMGLLRQREQNAFEGEQNDKKVFQQDWLNSRDFNRQFYGALSMIPIQNASQFSQLIAQYAMENPEVYTPDNIAGMTKFFNDNFRQIISQYLGDINLGPGGV